MKRILWISLIAALWMCGAVFGSEWDSTDLKISDVPISRGGCYESLQTFLGCASALDSAAHSLNPKEALITGEEYAGKGACCGKVEQDYGHLMLVEEGKIPMTRFRSGRELVRLDRQREKLHLEGLRSLFQKTHESQTVPFEQIFARFTILFSETEKEKEVAASMINAIMHYGKDPRARIAPLSPETYDATIVGIGTNVSMVGGYLVLHPLKGLPAERSGLRDYDVVLRIDGKPACASEQIEGPENANVEFEVLRDGESLSISVMRRAFNLPVVAFEAMSRHGKQLGYMKVNRFEENGLCEKLEAAVKELDASRVSGLIIDLRGNMGGYLDQVVCAAGLFVGKEVIAVERNLRANVLIPHRSTVDRITNLPLVVLINDQSASGSELFAGAIRDYRRGWLVGERTFGKGTGQGPIPCHMSKCENKVLGVIEHATTGWFYLPGGTSCHIKGIEPDFSIELVPGERDLHKHEEDMYLDHYPINPGIIEGFVVTDPGWRKQRVSEMTRCVDGPLSSKKVAEPGADIQLDYGLAILACGFEGIP